MLATAASEPSEVDPISPTTTAGGRKRSSSAATQSTATSPSKKARSGKATQSTAESPSKKSIWVKPGSTRKDKMKVTSLLQKLIDLDSTDQGPQQILDKAVQIKNQEEQATNEAIKTCLDLAVASGICKSSPEFFFLTKVFQSQYWRFVFLYFDTPDERLRWIHNAYADPKMHEI